MDVLTVEANGLEFAYFEEGRGPLVLLIHGFPDTPHSWDEVRPELAKAGFRAVTPFTRGYAPTQIPPREDYASETLGRDIVSLIEALGEEQAIVVGHDWGASAAYCAAASRPERIRLMVVVAVPHPGGLTPTPALLWAIRHFFRLRRKNAAEWIRRNDFAYIDELVQRWSPSWQVPPGATAAVKEVFREPGSLEAALGYYRALTPRRPRELRRKITVPSVAFAGEDDIFSVELYERVRSRFEASYQVVTMPGGHFMHREHPRHFIRELLRVLPR